MRILMIPNRFVDITNNYNPRAVSAASKAQNNITTIKIFFSYILLLPINQKIFNPMNVIE